MPRIFTTLLLVLFTLTVSAQAWELGVTGGAAGYMGDLNTRNMSQVSGGAFGGFVKKNFNPYLSLKAGFMHGVIAAADSNSKFEQNRLRNLSFSTTLNELSLMAEFNFLQYRPGIDKHAFSPYVFVGIGGVAFNPRARVDKHSDWLDLRPLMTEGQVKPYSNVAVTIPYGVGLKYNFTHSLSLIADVGYRSAKTDYLDDVSGNYKVPTPVRNEDLAIAKYFADRRLSSDKGSLGSQRGDGRSFDTYMFFSLSVSFTFVSDKCYFSY